MAQLQEQAEKGALFKGLLGAFQVPNFGGFRNGKAFPLSAWQDYVGLAALKQQEQLHFYVHMYA